MPRRSSSSVSSTSGSSESNIVFFAAGGHNHDGSNSSLIDASKYSIFDFDQGFLRTNTERSARQDRNRILFEDTIRSIFREAGVELGENVISAQNIIAGSITTNELAANTITAQNIAANSITANEIALNTITASNLSNTITLTSQVVRSNNYVVGVSGWAIYSNGYSEFGSGNYRGSITANSGTIGGWTIGSTTITGGSTTLDSAGSITVGNTSIAANGRITNGNFTLSATGELTATGASISGTINATSGTFSGTITANGTISGGTISGAAVTGSTFTTSGTRNVSISTNAITLNNAGGEASRINFIPGTSSSYGVINADGRLRLQSINGGSMEFGVTPSGGLSLNSGSSASSIDLIVGLGGAYIQQEYTTITGYLNPSYYSVRIGELYSKAGVYVASGDMNIVAGSLVKIRGGGNDPATTFVGINSNADLTCNAFTAFGTKAFRIKHPILEGMDLVHSSIEGPKVDLIYRGFVELNNGKAYVNIDENSKMTNGTFVKLCKDVQCYTTNESDWDAVRGRVDGNILTIESQNAESNAIISWIVIGTRQDEAIMTINATDELGDLLVEVPTSTRYD